MDRRKFFSTSVIGTGIFVSGQAMANTSTPGKLTVVDSVADMKQANLAFGDVIITRGYYVSGDGGHAQYRVVDGTDESRFGEFHQLDNGLQAQLMHDGVFNVKQFGAKGDGLHKDNIFIREAMLAASDIKGAVYFPVGTYRCGQIDLYSNITVYGDGAGSVLLRDRDLGPNDVLMRAIGGSSNRADNIKNVTIKNLHFLGTVEVDNFSEFKHLLLLQGVTNLKISNCAFNGWQGDAVVIRSGNENFQYKNLDITIINNSFYGANGDNRNAISVTDCSGLWIDRNTFSNCTRSNMPGAIDIEPNTDEGFVVLENIKITNNNFTNIGGNVACIAMYLPTPTENFSNKPRNIIIENNTMTNVFRGIHLAQIQSYDVTDTYPSINIKCVRNSVKNASDRGFWVFGVKGVTFNDNHFESCANASRIGWLEAARGCNNIALINNTFIHCGEVDGYGIIVYASDRINISDNTFDNIGVSNGGFGLPLLFTYGESSRIRIMNNTIINNENLTTAAISLTGGSIVSGANYFSNNDFLGLEVDGFIAN